MISSFLWWLRKEVIVLLKFQRQERRWPSWQDQFLKFLIPILSKQLKLKSLITKPFRVLPLLLELKLVINLMLLRVPKSQLPTVCQEIRSSQSWMSLMTPNLQVQLHQSKALIQKWKTFNIQQWWIRGDSTMKNLVIHTQQTSYKAKNLRLPLIWLVLCMMLMLFMPSKESWLMLIN